MHCANLNQMTALVVVGVHSTVTVIESDAAAPRMTLNSGRSTTRQTTRRPDRPDQCEARRGGAVESRAGEVRIHQAAATSWKVSERSSKTLVSIRQKNSAKHPLPHLLSPLTHAARAVLQHRKVHGSIRGPRARRTPGLPFCCAAQRHVSPSSPMHARIVRTA